MSTGTATHVSLLDAYQAELGILRTYPHNLLLEGPAAATDAVLLLLQPHRREPFLVNHPNTLLQLPERATRGLILRDVAALSADDQARLLVWLQGPGLDAQVVSTTERPLFPLVSQGLFDATLYYRLNVLLLRVGPSNPSSGSQERLLPRPQGPERIPISF